jgi:hypothetical protein
MHRKADQPRVALTGDYLEDTDRAVRICQQRHGFGGDMSMASNVGPMQAAHLFRVGTRIIDDV